MAEINLDQETADALLTIDKHAGDAATYTVLSPGDKVAIPLVSGDSREKFILDVNRNSIAVGKINYLSRARTAVILARLDLGGAPHQNPDGLIIAGHHLHLYREDYADKWAYPVPMDQFRDLTDLWETLLDFMDYIRVLTS